MKTIAVLNETELRGCSSNQKYPICLGCQLNVPRQTTLTDSTSILINVKHFIQVGLVIYLFNFLVAAIKMHDANSFSHTIFWSFIFLQITANMGRNYRPVLELPITIVVISES